MTATLQDAERRKISQFGPAIASGVLAIAVFAVTIGGTYVYDDFDVFNLDARLRHPSNWGQYWSQSYNGGVDNLYRPLVSMTYAIQWKLHGTDESDAWKYHLVNVILHAAASALVAELARRLGGMKLAWIVGPLFAVHPIHVEAVANIVGRAELMCALGVLGALVLFMQPMTIARAVAIEACFIVALLSKEQGMLTPLLILFLALSQRGARERGVVAVSPSGARLVLIALLTWSLAAYVVFRESILKFWWDRSFLDWTINPLVRPDADRWLMPLVLLGRYIALLVFPVKLSPDYGARVIGWMFDARDPYAWVGIAAVIAWIVWLIVAIRRRDRIATFALLSLAATYGVVSNFLTLIGTNFAERLMYLPSVFFLILIGLLLVKLPRAAVVPLMALLLVLASARSFTCARRWNDRLSFYQVSLQEQPRSIRLYLLLTSEYIARGELDKAEQSAAAACDELPEYWEVWVSRAMVAMERKRFDDAKQYLDRAAEQPRAPLTRITGFMRLLQQRRVSE